MKYNVTYRSDLYDAGRDWEGNSITGYEHTVMLELENGQRFLLTTSAYCDTVVQNGEVQNDSDMAIDITNARVNRIKVSMANGTKLNPLYWEETDPVYGTEFKDMLPMDNINLFKA